MSGRMTVSQDGIEITVEWPTDDPLTVTQFVEAMEALEKAWRAVQPWGAASKLLADSLTYCIGDEEVEP